MAGGMRQNRWHSWHLHLDSADPAVAERALLEVVRPVLSVARPWFFIRYWQGGPHLRLRVADLDDGPAAEFGATLAGPLARVNAGIQAAHRIDPAGYRAEAARLASAGEGGRPLGVEELRPGGVYQESYQPEFGRYGGVELMPLSERLFHVSSVVALRVCVARGGVGAVLSTGLQRITRKTVLLTGGAINAKITGVMKDIPENSQIKADMIVSMSSQQQLYGNTSDSEWSAFNLTSYLLLKAWYRCKKTGSKTSGILR